MLLFASISFAQGIDLLSVPAVFDTATTTSTLDLNDYRYDGYKFAGIQFDSTNKSTSYSLKVSSGGSHYGDLKDIDGTIIGAFTVTANSEDVYGISIPDAIPFDYCYLESDSTETATVQFILWKEK